MNKKVPSFEELGLNELDARDRSLYLMWESSQYRSERINTKLWVVILVLIVALIASNAGWIYYENSFEDVVVTQEAVTDGSNEIHLQNIGGDYYGGESETDSENKGEENP